MKCVLFFISFQEVYMQLGRFKQNFLQNFQTKFAFIQILERRSTKQYDETKYIVKAILTVYW